MPYALHAQQMVQKADLVYQNKIDEEIQKIREEYLRRKKEEEQSRIPYYNRQQTADARARRPASRNAKYTLYNIPAYNPGFSSADESIPDAPPTKRSVVDESEKYYKVLGIDPSKIITEQDITKAYKKQALLYHPDRPKGNTENFQELSNAYQRIMELI